MAFHDIGPWTHHIQWAQPKGLLSDLPWFPHQNQKRFLGPKGTQGLKKYAQQSYHEPNPHFPWLTVLTQCKSNLPDRQKWFANVKFRIPHFGGYALHKIPILTTWKIHKKTWKIKKQLTETYLSIRPCSIPNGHTCSSNSTWPQFPCGARDLKCFTKRVVSSCSCIHMCKGRSTP